MLMSQPCAWVQCFLNLQCQLWGRPWHSFPWLINVKEKRKDVLCIPQFVSCRTVWYASGLKATCLRLLFFADKEIEARRGPDASLVPQLVSCRAGIWIQVCLALLAICCCFSGCQNVTSSSICIKSISPPSPSNQFFFSHPCSFRHQIKTSKPLGASGAFASASVGVLLGSLPLS